MDDIFDGLGDFEIDEFVILRFQVLMLWREIEIDILRLLDWLIHVFPMLGGSR